MERGLAGPSPPHAVPRMCHPGGVGQLWDLACPRVRAQQMTWVPPPRLCLQLYHINETRGLLKKINSVLQKITDPIQPKVAEHRPQTTKRLSYPFSREKQHL